MEKEIKLSSDKKDQDYSIFSRNSKITELLELCIEPSSKHEMKNILLDFWDKFKQCVLENEDFCEMDVLCIYALSYVQNHKDWSLSAVSRSVYMYLKQNNLPASDNNRNKLINCSERSFVTALRQFTNFHSEEGEKILEHAVFKCVHRSNFGLSLFLIKFGLLKFPTELDEKTQHMFAELVLCLNSAFDDKDLWNMQAHPKALVKLDNFFNWMKHSNISIRRSMLIVINIFIILEYQSLVNFQTRLRDKSSINIIELYTKLCFHKFLWLDKITEATTETLITLRDIENFEAHFLNFLPSESDCLSLGGIARKLFPETRIYYNPRSLKDHTRCKIRESLGCSTTLPAQVYQLPIPVTLKEFLLFGNEDTWEYLKSYQQTVYINHKMSRDLQNSIA